MLWGKSHFLLYSFHLQLKHELLIHSWGLCFKYFVPFLGKGYQEGTCFFIRSSSTVSYIFGMFTKIKNLTASWELNLWNCQLYLYTHWSNTQIYLSFALVYQACHSSTSRSGCGLTKCLLEMKFCRWVHIAFIHLQWNFFERYIWVHKMNWEFMNSTRRHLI